MPVWELTERFLEFPATLHVLKQRWWIQEYFPGPDARYRGFLFKVDGKDVPDYVENLKKSWEKFESVYPSLKSESGVRLSGFGGIEIFINFYGSGISIMGQNGRISDRSTLEACLRDLNSAASRAAMIQSRLEGIDELGWRASGKDGRL